MPISTEPPKRTAHKQRKIQRSTPRHRQRTEHRKTRKNPGFPRFFARFPALPRKRGLPLVGLEQPSECSEKQQVERKEAQNTAQHRAGTEHAPDPDLAKLIDAWPSLPVETRQAILE